MAPAQLESLALYQRIITQLPLLQATDTMEQLQWAKPKAGKDKDMAPMPEEFMLSEGGCQAGQHRNRHQGNKKMRGGGKTEWNLAGWPGEDPSKDTGLSLKTTWGGLSVGGWGAHIHVSEGGPILRTS
jgi:hypothetical protein